MGSQYLLRWNMWFILFRFCLFLVFVSLGMCLFICIVFQWLYNQDRLSLGRRSSSILFVHGTLLVCRDLFFSVTLYYFNNSLNYVSVYCMYRTAISEWWGVGVVICLERGADCLHMVQLMPLPSPKPHHILPHLNPDWFYLSGTGLPRLSWKTGH